MKKNKIISVAVMGLILIVLVQLFISTKRPNINVYCDNQYHDTCPIGCVRADIPKDSLHPDDVMTYYKINDNCNFQTLAFNIKSEKTRYTILGRFNGKKTRHNLYQIDSLEVKFYNIYDSNNLKYKVGRVEIDEKDLSKLVVKLIIDNKSGVETEIDYIYGSQEDEKPLKVNNDTNIEFEIVNLDKKTAFVPAGGYECNGKILISN